MAASMARRAVKPLKELESPFLANHSSVLEELYRFTIETVDTVSRKEVWVSSELPSVIQLKLRDIQHAVKEGEKLDSDCFKLAIRNMAREDVENFKNTKYLGWKHYVDSDWTKSVARGVDRTSLKTVFYRQSILYNASDSRLILIPVLHNEHWTLYAFKKSDRKLSILDSLPDSAERHHQIRLQVYDNLNKTMDTAFDMSENDFRSWTHEFPEVPRQANSCDCGFFVFNFMRLWDGHRLVESFRTESRELRKDFLAYILSCKENGATLPTNVASWINDPVVELKIRRKSRQPWAWYPMDSSLREAVIKGNLEAFQRLLDSEARNQGATGRDDVSSQDVQGAGTAEMRIDIPQDLDPPAAVLSSNSVAHADAPLLRSMLLRGVTSDADGVLHVATRLGHVDLVQAIFSNVDAAAGAVTFSNQASVRFADFLRARNHKGETCLHEAVRHGHTGLVSLLLSEDAKLDEDDGNSPALVRILDDEGVSPLYLATTLRHVDIVRMLTNVDYRYSDSVSCAGPAGKTALHAAVLLSTELCELLLTGEKSLTKKPDEFGRTPLHYLGNSGGTAITELILEEDTLSGYCADSEGSLPIHVAASKGRLGIIKILLHKCPDCDSSCNALGRTFLHVAVDEEQPNVVEYVCSERRLERILNMRDRNGDTALHLAVLNGNEEIFCRLLRNKKVCLSFINKKGCTPLDLAFSSIKPSSAYKQIKRQWIRNDLLVTGADFTGADFCTYRWNHFSSRSAAMSEADYEKESERISKSAALLAGAAVLISTIAFQAPFNMAGKKSLTANNVSPEAEQAIAQIDASSLYCSGFAIFCCTFAGFPTSSSWHGARFVALIFGGFYVFAASVTIVLVFATGLSLVYPGNGSNGLFYIFFIIAEIYGLAAIVFWSSVIMMHAGTRCARLGFRAWCCSLFRRRPAASSTPLMTVVLLASSVVITFNILLNFAKTLRIKS